MRQLVNLDCVLCGERIVCDVDAEFCDSCRQPAHLRCKSPPQNDPAACGACGACGSRLGPAAADDECGLDVVRGSEVSDDQVVTGSWLLHLFSLRGRVDRGDYLLHSVLDGIITMALMMGVALLLGEVSAPARPLVQLAIWAIFITAAWIEFAITVKRLHDLGRPGWHGLLLAIPVYNIYLSCLLTFRAGTPGANRYGNSPVDSGTFAPGEALLIEASRWEMKGDWDRALKLYQQVAEELNGQPGAAYAVGCIQRIREKMGLAADSI